MDAPRDAPASSQANTGPSRALTVKFRNPATPAALPLTSDGLASLITVYGSMAAPLARPATSPTTYGGNTSGRPYRIQVRQANRTPAPATITGLRRPIQSDSHPRSGHPMIQPSGTIADRITAAP